MTIGLSPRQAKASGRIRAVSIALLLAAAPTLVQAAPEDRYYERSFVLAANANCGLFEPRLAAALNAAAWQARGAALRAGANARDLAQTAARARARAAATACGSPDLKTVRGRVEHAFAGWTRTPRMQFPGDAAGWRADRTVQAEPGWRLVQATTTGASPVRFGLTGARGQSDRLAAVVSWHGRPRPTAVRLVLRDGAVAPRPWLARALPPQPQRRVIWASGVQAADAGLLKPDRDEGQAWFFPLAAADALAGLDPREVFAVEFVFRDGSVAAATFEAGDFAAGRAFLAMGRV